MAKLAANDDDDDDESLPSVLLWSNGFFPFSSFSFFSWQFFSLLLTAQAHTHFPVDISTTIFQLDRLRLFRVVLLPLSSSLKFKASRSRLPMHSLALIRILQIYTAHRFVCLGVHDVLVSSAHKTQ